MSDSKTQTTPTGSQAAKNQPDNNHRTERIRQRMVVWALRLIVGAVFVVSGLAKTIDIWGFIYKIEDYLTVWQFTVPRSLVLMGAMLLSGAELVGGFMLLTGCYRRFSVRLLSLIMAGM
ncbi:MAG: DoxX family protein, partial [Paramuribaculum sp.]|nr:DoxX family protein [Paramuribaculum sp.]